MPITTPLQKIERVNHFGGTYITVKLVGQTYDESAKFAHEYCHEQNQIYIHAFNDPLTIAGQGTVGKEIIEQLPDGFDIAVAPIGGGGFISGVSEYVKAVNPKVSIYGAEPENAAAMEASFKQKKLVTLDKIDTFVDGAAVQSVGKLTFEICQRNLKKIVVVPVGRICKTMIDLYQNEGIISEPAGVLSLAALSSLREEIKGKTVVCIISGGNNDVLRYPEILEKSLVYQGLKHYFIIEFAQKPGQLRLFLDHALGPNDDIVRFEYMKKTNKEKGAALVGIELKDRNDLEPFLRRLEKVGINYQKLSDKEMLYDYII